MHKGESAHFFNSVRPDDAADGKIEGHVTAVLKLGVNDRHFFLLSQSYVDQELLGLQTAGEMDQVGRDEDSAAAGGCLDQVDLISLHDIFAVSDSLTQAETADDFFIQLEHLPAKGVIGCCREYTALCRKGIGNIKIESISDTESAVFIAQHQRFHDKLAAGGKLLHDDFPAAGPAGGLLIFFSDLLLVCADLYAAAALCVQRLDDHFDGRKSR